MIEALQGVKVLVVEEEYLVAALMEDILEYAGWLVAGPITRLAQALDAASSQAYDVAVLDVNLAGERVYPVADILAQRNVPLRLCHRLWRVARRVRQSAAPLQAVQDGRLARRFVGYRQNCASKSLGPNCQRRRAETRRGRARNTKTSVIPERGRSPRVRNP